jgi:hypothetical protein
MVGRLALLLSGYWTFLNSILGGSLKAVKRVTARLIGESRQDESGFHSKVGAPVTEAMRRLAV